MKEYNKKNNQSKTSWNIIVILNAILLIWIIASFIDVNLHNLNPEPSYSFWNLFRVFWG